MSRPAHKYVIDSAVFATAPRISQRRTRRRLGPKALPVHGGGVYSRVEAAVEGVAMRLACESVVPGLECTYVATGETAEEVHTAMMDHGAQRHANLMDGMSEEERQTMSADMSGLIYELIAEGN